MNQDNLIEVRDLAVEFVVGAPATGGSVDDIQSWPGRIKAVTAKDVQEAAQHWLDKRRSVTGYLVKETKPDSEKAEQPQKKEKRT